MFLHTGTVHYKLYFVPVFVQFLKSILYLYLNAFLSTYFIFVFKYILKVLVLGTHSFVKVPRPGDSEVTFLVFESSCHLLLPVPVFLTIQWQRQSR